MIAFNFPDDAAIQEQVGRCREATERMRTASAAKIRDDSQKSESAADGDTAAAQGHFPV
jgi:hypothetical protein